MSFSGIRGDLQDNLETIIGLKVYDTIPDALNEFPATIMFPKVPIKYHQVAQNKLAEMHWEVTVLFMRWSDVSQSQRELDDYLDRQGSKSIQVAIENQESTDNYQLIHCEECTFIGEISHGNTSYLGAKFSVLLQF